jgi:hypothetical protein
MLNPIRHPNCGSMREGFLFRIDTFAACARQRTQLYKGVLHADR